MGKESGAWRRLDEIAQTIEHAPFMERVELTATKGWPDVQWTSARGDAVCGRIELKRLHLGKTGSPHVTERALGVRAEQAVHLRRYAERKGLAGVVALVDVIDEWLYWPADPSLHWAEMIRKAPGVLAHQRFPNTRDGIAAMFEAWRQGR